jgi:hypothetical protein
VVNRALRRAGWRVIRICSATWQNIRRRAFTGFSGRLFVAREVACQLEQRFRDVEFGIRVHPWLKNARLLHQGEARHGFHRLARIE